MAHPNQPSGGPAGAGQNMAASFNAMLQRSMRDQQHQEPVSEAPSNPPQTINYGGVYDATPPPQPQPGPPPPPQTQPNTLGSARGPQAQPVLPVDLPPQAFLTSAMLLDMVDKKVDVLLRDEKEYIGILRSYDQFANLVLTECIERIAARNPDADTDSTTAKWLACDVICPGVMTIRGENVTICATVDLDMEDYPKAIKHAPEKEVRALAAAQKAEQMTAQDKKAKALKHADIEPSFAMLG